MSARTIFQRAEIAYSSGDAPEALKLYAKAIRKILADEDVTQPFLPAGMEVSLPPDMPRELIGAIWRNLCGFFRDPALRLNAETAPDAYKLMASFKPSSEQHNSYQAFAKRGAHGLAILKAMQITATFTTGLMAWDKKDRATAARRYQDALALADTHPPFNSKTPKAGLETWVCADVQQTRDNLKILIDTDTKHAIILGEETIGRKETRELPKPSVRFEPDGSISLDDQVSFATDVCYACGSRGAKMSKCSKCKKATYCGRDCQLAHWPTHKAPCKAVTSTSTSTSAS